jgi:hypothetical protein
MKGMLHENTLRTGWAGSAFSQGRGVAAYQIQANRADRAVGHARAVADPGAVFQALVCRTGWARHTATGACPEASLFVLAHRTRSARQARPRARVADTCGEVGPRQAHGAFDPHRDLLVVRPLVRDGRGGCGVPAPTLQVRHVAA